MSKSYPTVEFKCLHPAKLNLDKYHDNDSRGCVLEVYNEYPKKFHEFQSDFF